MANEKGEKQAKPPPKQVSSSHAILHGTYPTVPHLIRSLLLETSQHKQEAVPMEGVVIEEQNNKGKMTKANRVTLQESAETFGAAKPKPRPDLHKGPVMITDALNDVRVK
jgi:hypothetical protein